MPYSTFNPSTVGERSPGNPGYVDAASRNSTRSGNALETSAVLPGSRRRILIGADTFSPDINGAARFARDHAVRLARRGHEVHVIAPATSTRRSSGIERFDGVAIQVHRLRSVRWPLHDWLRFAPPWEVRYHVRRILRTVHPDIVHLQSFIDIGRGLAVEAELARIPIVATNHVMPENIVEFSGLPERLHPRLTQFGWNLASATFARADIVTSPTPIAARYLEVKTGLPQVHAVSCGIDLHRFTPKTDKPAAARILYVGRLDPEKDLDTLLEAFALVPRQTGARLDIVGGGTEGKALEILACQLRIADRVTFHGRVSDSELERLHHRASVFVMPSPAELQSIATLEALASGTPVVVADAMALPHLVDNGVEGYRVPTGNAHDFADRIERILATTPEQYRRLSAAALSRACQHDAAIVVTHYERLYERLCSNPILVAA